MLLVSIITVILAKSELAKIRQMNWITFSKLELVRCFQRERTLHFISLFFFISLLIPSGQILKAASQLPKPWGKQPILAPSMLSGKGIWLFTDPWHSRIVSLRHSQARLLCRSW